MNKGFDKSALPVAVITGLMIVPMALTDPLDYQEPWMKYATLVFVGGIFTLAAGYTLYKMFKDEMDD
jgi:hypothetical protein